jgi:hypothetical protein|nr:MAG TPA: Major capsid protein [Caudoviricetes sp.]
MALNISIWQNTLVENFYPDNSFASKSVDDSVYAKAKKVIIPNAGKPSNVETNRSSTPATVNQRTDKDLEYEIDELTTDPIEITNAETVELSYDKRTSIISNDRSTLQNEAFVNLLERWGKGVPTSNVLLTSGTVERDAHTSPTAIGKRKSVTKKDVLAIMTRMNADNVPEEGRYLLLDAYMYTDLLEELSDSESRAFLDSVDAQKGIAGKLFGLNIMQRSQVLRIKPDKAILPWKEAAVAGELAAALAWQEQSVSRALGEVKMFDSTNNPLYYGDIYSFLLRTGGSVRRYDKKGVYLLAEAAK